MSKRKAPPTLRTLVPLVLVAALVVTLAPVPTHAPADASSSDDVSVPLQIVEIDASSYERNNPPEDVIDGNLRSRWAAEGIGEWIGGRLEQPSTLERIELAFHQGNRRTAEFGVEVSPDNATWTEILRTSSSGRTLQFESFALSGEASYFRVVGYGNSSRWSQWISITELRVHGTPLPPPVEPEPAPEDVVQPTPEPQALSFSSLGASSYEAGNPPAAAVDGDLVSRWAAEGLGEWIGGQLEQPAELESIEIAFFQGDQRTADFGVEVSSDNDTWTEVLRATSSGRTLAMESYGLEGSAHYVRVVGYGNSGRWSAWNSITELQVIGTPAATPPSSEREPVPAPEPELEQPPVVDADVPQTADARWSAAPDAVVNSWAQAEAAAVDGARIIHLTGGTYGTYTFRQPGIFIRNLPGQRVVVDGTFVASAPDVTLAGVEIAGRFEGRNDGNNATLYRSVLTGSGAVTFNGGGSPLLGRLVEVHSTHRGAPYSGTPDVWETSNIVTVNHGASVEFDGVWIVGRDATKDVLQVINGGRDVTIRNSYLGRGPSATLHLITPGRVDIEDTYLDWWPHPLGGGIGWEMRSSDVRLSNVTAFRPFFRLNWDNRFAQSLVVEDSVFYNVPEIRRAGNMLFNNNFAANGHFPNNSYQAEKPTAPTYRVPSWMSELG